MKAKRRETINNIQYVGIHMLKINEILNEKKMSQVIRITDTKQEIDYSVSKIKNQQSYINLKVRNYILVRVLETQKYIIISNTVVLIRNKYLEIMHINLRVINYFISKFHFIIV